MAGELAIFSHDNGRRYVKIAGRRIWIETYALSSSQRFESVYRQLSQIELRRALDIEWSNPRRRRSTLLRLTGRLCKLERDEKMNAIRNNVASKSRTDYPRRPLHTVPEIEAAALRTFEPRRNQAGELVERSNNGTSYRSTLTKRMRERRAEFEGAALAAARAKGRDNLTKREREDLRRQAGDHFHDHVSAGELCEICNEVIERIS
jgi:hypothetical protein